MRNKKILQRNVKERVMLNYIMISDFILNQIHNTICIANHVHTEQHQTQPAIAYNVYQ